MLRPREFLSEQDIRDHIERAGLASLLRRLFFKQQPELARVLGVSNEQMRGLMSSRLDLTEALADKLSTILGLPQDFFLPTVIG